MALVCLDITILSRKLCAPVGGFGSALLSVASTAQATQPTTLTTTPTIPPSVTAPGAVSSVLATATLSPNLGNPAALSSYPRCAVSFALAFSWEQVLLKPLTLHQQICNNETVIVIRQTSDPSFDQSSIQNSCSESFRSLTAGCEAATCDK